ncbi:MAG: hypothetical protein SGJ01_00715 [Gemmatimonadota bacterium]|nr:hypothetical protein [Gemmatimonadota bacterium]
MASPSVRDQLVARSVSARYNLFVGLGAVLAVVGLGSFLLTLQGEQADRAWHLFHVNWIYFTGLTGGSFAFVAVQKITKAKWSGVIIRFAEATPFFFFPVSLAGFLLIFTVGYPHIFPDMHGLGHGKEVWLSHGFMFARLGIGLSLLYYLGFSLVKADLIPDMHEVKDAVVGSRRSLYDRWTAAFDTTPEGRARHDARIYTLAPLYVITYALVMTMVAFDCMMALQPHWFSNLLGGWYFMGSFLGAHTLLALMMLYGRHEVGINEFISQKQRHDLGKLCFGFSVFWTYLMWSQFLVIWYGNLPEETGFVFARLWGAWRPIGIAVFVGMFVIPFTGLLGVAPKKTPITLGFFTAVSLCALWLERYLMVLPSVTHEAGPVFGLAEAGPTVAFLGLFLLCYGLFARTFPMVSPRLAMITLEKESGHH